MPQPSAIDDYLRQNGLEPIPVNIGAAPEQAQPSAIDDYLRQNGLEPIPVNIGAAPEQPKEASDTGAAGQAYGSLVRGFTGTVASLPEAMGLIAYNWQRKYFGGVDGQTPEEWSGLMKVGGALRNLGEAITPEESEKYKHSLWATDVPSGIGTVLGFAVGSKGLGGGLKAAAGGATKASARASAHVEARLIARGMAPEVAKRAVAKSHGKAAIAKAAQAEATGWGTASLGTIGAATSAVEGWGDAVATLLAKAKAEGRDELTDAEYEQAWESFIFNIPAGVSEIAGANRIALKLFKNLDKGTKGKWSAGWRRIVKDAAGGATEEALQESFQTAWMNLGAAEVAKYDENRELFEGVLHAGGVGGIIGGMFGGLVAGVNRKANLYNRILELKKTKAELEKSGSTETAAEVQKEIDEAMGSLGTSEENRKRLVEALAERAEAEFDADIESRKAEIDEAQQTLREQAKGEILENFTVLEPSGLVRREFPDTGGLYATTTEPMTVEEAAEVTEQEFEEVDVEVEDEVRAGEIKRTEKEKAKLEERLNKGDLSQTKAQEVLDQIGKLEASLETLKGLPKTRTEKQKRAKDRRSVTWVLRDKDGKAIEGEAEFGMVTTLLNMEQVEEAVRVRLDAEEIYRRTLEGEAEEAKEAEKREEVDTTVEKQLAEIEKQVEAEEAEAKQRAEVAGLDQDQTADLSGAFEPQIVLDPRDSEAVDPIVYEVLDDDVEVTDLVLTETNDPMLGEKSKVYKVKQLGELKKAQAAVNKAEGILKREGLTDESRKVAIKRLKEAKARLRKAKENQTRFVDAAFMQDLATAKAEETDRAEGQRKFEEEEAKRIREEDEAAAEPFTRRATDEAIELARKLGYLSTAEELEAKGLIESLGGQVPTAGGVAVDPDTGAQLYWNIDIKPTDRRRNTISEGDVVNRGVQKLLLDKEYAQEESFQKWFKDTFAGDQDALSLLMDLNSEAAIEQRGGVVLSVDTIKRLRAEKNEEIKAEQKAAKGMSEAARERAVRVAIHKARLEHEAKEKKLDEDIEAREGMPDRFQLKDIKRIVFKEPSTSRVEADFTEAEEAQLVQSMLLETTRADAPITTQEMRIMHTALVNKEAAKEQEAEPATKTDEGILKRLKAEVKKVLTLIGRKGKEIDKAQKKVDATESKVAGEASKLDHKKEQLLEKGGKWKQLQKWYTWAANRAKQIKALEGMLETHGAGVERIFANELEAELRQKVLSILKLDKNADISVTENGIRIALNNLRADKARVEAFIAEIEVDALGKLQANVDAAKKKGIPAEQKLKELEAEKAELEEAAANYNAAIEGEMGEVKVRIGRREMATATLWEGVTRGIRYRIYRLDQETRLDYLMREAVTELAALQKEFAGRRNLTVKQRENYQNRIASLESRIAAFVEEGAGTFFVNTASTYSEKMSLKQFDVETTGQNAGGYIILGSGKNSTGTIDAPVTRDEAMRWMESEGEGKGKGPFTVTFTTPHSFATLEAVKDFMGATVRSGAVSYEAGGIEYFSRRVKVNYWSEVGQVRKDAAARGIERINELKAQIAELDAVRNTRSGEVSIEGDKGHTKNAKKIKEYVKAFKEAVIGELAGKVITRDGKEEVIHSSYEGVVVDKIVATFPSGEDAKLLRIGDGVFVKINEPTTIYINPNILMKHFTVTNGVLLPKGGKTNRTMTSVVREELSHLLDLQTIYSLLESRKHTPAAVKRYLAKIGDSLTAKQRELLEGVYTGHKHRDRNKNTGKLTPSQLGMEALRMLREKPDILMFETEDAARSRPVYQNVWKQLRVWVENKFGATDARIDKEGNRVQLPSSIRDHLRAANSYLSIQRDAQGREIYAEAHASAGGQPLLYLRIPSSTAGGAATIYYYENTKEGWEKATAKLNEEWDKLPKETRGKHNKDELIQTLEGLALKNIDQAAVLRPQGDLSFEQKTYVLLNELRGIPLSDTDVKALEKVLTSLEADRLGRKATQGGRKPVKVTLEEKDKNWATYVSVMARREARTVWGEIDGGEDAQASYGQFRTTVLPWLKREQMKKGATKEEAEEDARTKELPRGIAETDAVAFYTNLFARKTVNAFRDNYVVSVSYTYTAGKDATQVAKVERLKAELEELKATEPEGESGPKSERQRTRQIDTLKKEIKAAGTVSKTWKFPATEQGKKDAQATAFKFLRRQAAIDRGKSTKEEQEKYDEEMLIKDSELLAKLEAQARKGVELKEGIKVGEGAGGKTGILVVGSLDPKHEGAAKLLGEHAQEFQKHYYAKKRGNMAQYLKLVNHRRLVVQPTYQELLDERAQSLFSDASAGGREVTHRDRLIVALDRYDESIKIIEEQKTYVHPSAAFQTEEEAKKYIETKEWQVKPTVTPVDVVAEGALEQKWVYRKPILNEQGQVSGAEVVAVEEDALLPKEKGSKIRSWKENKIRFAMVDGQKTRVTREIFEEEATTRTEYKLIGGRIQNRLDEDHLLTEVEMLVLETFLNESGDMALMPAEAGKALDAIANNPNNPLHEEVLALYKSGAIENDILQDKESGLLVREAIIEETQDQIIFEVTEEDEAGIRKKHGNDTKSAEKEIKERKITMGHAMRSIAQYDVHEGKPVRLKEGQTAYMNYHALNRKIALREGNLIANILNSAVMKLKVATDTADGLDDFSEETYSANLEEGMDVEGETIRNAAAFDNPIEGKLGVKLGFRDGSFFSSATDTLRKMEIQALSTLADKIDEYYNRETELYGQFFAGMHVLERGGVELVGVDADGNNRGNGVNAYFNTKEEAMTYAKDNGWDVHHTVSVKGYGRAAVETAEIEAEVYFKIRERRKRVKYTSKILKTAALDKNRRLAEYYLSSKMSEAGKALVAWQKGVGVDTGALLKKAGVQVAVDDDKENWKPVRILGADHFPRVFSQQTWEIIRNPSSHPAAYENMMKLMVEGEAATDKDHAHKKLQGYLKNINQTESQTIHDFFANIEKARSFKLPDEFYDTSMDAYKTYMRKFTSRMAQIEVFGQKHKHIEDGTVNPWVAAREAVTGDNAEYIDDLHRSVYRVQVGRDQTLEWLTKIGLPAAGVLYLSGPLTSIRNTTFALRSNAESFGAPETFFASVKTLYSIATGEYKKAEGDYARAQSLGLLRSDWVEARQYALSTDDITFGAEHKYREKMSKLQYYALYMQRATENFNRTVTAAMALQHLRTTREAYETDPQGKTAAQGIAMIQRMGYSPEQVKKLFSKDKDGNWDADSATKDRFVRDMVFEKQYGYNIRQHPLWMDNPTNRILFQFQKWGYQRTRDFGKNVLMPAFVGTEVTMPDGTVKKVRDAKMLFRNLFLFIGQGQLYATLMMALFYDKERDEMVIPVSEESGDWMLGLGEMLRKDLIYDGGLGIVTDWASWTHDQVDKRASRYKQPIPLNPPAYTLAQDSIDIIRNISNVLRNDTGKGAKREAVTSVLEDAAKKLPFIRSLYGTYHSTTRALGIETYGLAVQDGKKDVRIIRAAGRKFADLNGYDDARVWSGGKIAQTEKRELYTQLYEALLVGDVRNARAVRDRLLGDATGKERKAILSGMKASMKSRQPLLIDGKQPTDKIQREFMRWIKKELPSYSDRIKSINDRYWHTARGAGLK